MSSRLKLRGVMAGCLLIQVLAFAFALAVGGDQASTPGTPGQKPLHLLSVTLKTGGSVQNGADVPLSPELILEFDKNVVNSVIWANNSKCISMVAEDGANIPIRVSKIDDTVDVSQRQNIFVQPVQPLAPGTIYHLKVSPQLKGKNGVTLGGATEAGISLSFKTEGEAAAAPLPAREKTDMPAPPADAGTPNAAVEQNPEEAAGRPAASAPVDTKQADKGKSAQSQSRFALIGFFLLVGWIGVEIIGARKRKSGN